MKRYKFRLETVLRARRAQESLAQANLARAIASVLAAEAALKDRAAHYEAVKDASGPDFLAKHERALLAAGALIEAEGSLGQAKEARTAATVEYLETARAVSVLERLDERRQAEHALAALREDIVVVDELVTNRSQRNRRPPQ
jgi:flagellar biosynthesis chaperone FliJ